MEMICGAEVIHFFAKEEEDKHWTELGSNDNNITNRVSSISG